MKTLIILALTIFSTVALAGRGEAIEEFTEDTRVQQLLEYHESKGAKISTNIDVALISKKCGYAGCVAQYIVTRSAIKSGEQSLRMVKALVKISDYEDNAVELIHRLTLD